MKGTNRPLHEIFEEQARPSGEEVADRNTYDDSNLRRALQRTGLRRPTLDAELFAGYARHFAQRGWIVAPPAVRGAISTAGIRDG